MSNNSIVVEIFTWPCLVIDAMQIEFSVQILKDSFKILQSMSPGALIIFVASIPFCKAHKTY